MSTRLTVDLSCACGARLVATSDYASDVRPERQAFLEQHADCQPLTASPSPSPSRARIPLARRRA